MRSFLCAYLDGGYIPDGNTRPSLLKTFSAQSNIIIDSEDLLIICATHAVANNIAHIWSTKGSDLWQYVGPLSMSVPLTDFAAGRVVSSLMQVISNSLSTTSTILSGNMHAVSL